MPQSRRPSSRLSYRARQRRRAARRRLGALLAGVIVVAVVVILVASGGGSSKPASRRTSSGKSPSTAKRGARHHAVKQANPLTTKAVGNVIAARNPNGKVTVTAAVLNLKTGKEWVLNPSVRDQTASIIKADILETLLHQTEEKGDSLADAETDVAAGMIQDSSDTDATELWNTIGQGPGIAAYNKLAGLTGTTPHDDGYWGETLTSAADQIKVLEQLAKPSKLLSKQAQDYELYLMRHIDTGQGWGVSGGVPGGVSVALKNGWVNLTSYTDWEINSIGWIKGDGRDYLISVLTAHDPSEDYGIKTIDKISAGVYKALAPAKLAPAKHS